MHGLKVFSRLGECLGLVIQIDENAIQKQRVDRVRILILRDPKCSLPESLVLEIDGVQFSVGITVEEEEEEERSTWKAKPPVVCRPE